MKYREVFLLLLFYSFSLYIYPQDGSDISFVNVGKMNIAHNGFTEDVSSLFIPDGIKVIESNTEIILSGILTVGKNFYQDSPTNVFSESSGKVLFNGGKQNITSSYIDGFQRGDFYIDFPIIHIENNSVVKVASQMGIDALRITRPSTETPSSDNGLLYLESTPANDENKKHFVHNASLRVKDNQPLEAGIVAIEYHVECFRTDDQETCAFFPFATPFNSTQRAAYFAGNWLRAPQKYEYSEYLHYSWPYANEADPNTGYIHGKQYVTDAAEELKPGEPYLIKLRPLEYDYGQLDYLLTSGKNENYYQHTYLFDGKAHNLVEDYVSEVLFTTDTLFSTKIEANAADIDETINWIIGNSYTSPLSVKKIVEDMIASSLVFVPELYIFNPGSSTYKAYRLDTDEVPSLDTLDLIPSMSVFMLRLDRNQNQSGTFSITKKHLVHGKTSGSSLFSDENNNSSYSDVLLRVSPEENQNLNDYAVVGLRNNASAIYDNLDIPKAYNSSTDIFQLYSLSEDNVKLSSNAVGENTEKVLLGFSAGEKKQKFTIHASRLETVTENGVWLEDLFTGDIVDLKTSANYTFYGDRTDDPVRFILHFTEPVPPTSLEEKREDLVNCYYYDQYIKISGLKETDIGNDLNVYDVNGQLVMRENINSFPTVQYPFNMKKGVYILKISGSSIALKFIN